MRSTFASSVNLTVTKQAAEMSEIEAYLLEQLVSEWKSAHRRVSNESRRGDLKLEQYLDNNEQGVLDVVDMSERLRNHKPYGMVESMKVQT